MSSKLIPILVVGAASRWLPARFDTATDPKTGRRVKTRSLCAKKLLKPGANRITRDHWDLVKDHPTVKIWVELGHLKLDPSDAEVAANTHAPDPVTGLKNLSIAKAKPWIAASTDVEQLRAWGRLDERVGIVALIDERVGVLESGDDAGDDEPEDDEPESE